MTNTDREIIRLLMRQVREEQAMRLALDRALAGKEAIPAITDEELDARINELREVAQQNNSEKKLDKKSEKS